MVGMYILSIRARNKNKAKKKEIRKSTPGTTLRSLFLK